MHEKTFTTNLSIDEITSRLSSLDNFKVKNTSAHELNASVGSAFKFRMIGVYVTDKYQAPISIKANREGGVTAVTLASNAPGVYNTPKAEQFFERGYAQIQQILGA